MQSLVQRIGDRAGVEACFDPIAGGSEKLGGISRRAVLIAGSALTASTALRFSAPAAVAASRPQDFVLTDQRYRESLDFAAVLCRDGARRLEIAAGITRIWLDVLEPLWRGGGSSVAGLTRRETWVCLAEQARSRGRRSVFVGLHVPEPSNRALSHRLTAPQDLLDGLASRMMPAEPWPCFMARLATRCPVDARTRTAAIFRSPADPSTSPTLVSWIIA